MLVFFILVLVDPIIDVHLSHMEYGLDLLLFLYHPEVDILQFYFHEGLPLPIQVVPTQLPQIEVDID